MSFDSVIELFTQPVTGRLFAVGDLHGCYDQLMQQLELIDFNYVEDLLVCSGDLVDRGPNSIKCLKLIEETWFKSVRGNHEQLCIDSQIDPLMQDIHTRHGGAWFYQLDGEAQNQIIKQCQSLPIVLEISYGDKRYGFVHGDVHLNNWNDFIQAILTDDYYNSNEQSAIQTALWGQGRIRYGADHSAYSAVEGIDEVYLGHTVVSQITQRKNCFYIDTGAGLSGKLSIIELLN